MQRQFQTQIDRKRDRDDDDLPIDVEVAPIRSGLQHHSYNVYATWGLNTNVPSTLSATQVTIVGKQSIVVSSPTNALSYTYVALRVTGGTGGTKLTRAGGFLPLGSPGLTLEFNADLFVPRSKNPVSFGQAAIFGSIVLPIFMAGQQTQSRFILRSTAASISSATVQGTLFAGRPSHDQNWLFQNPQFEFPAYLIQSTTLSSSTISNVPIEKGITQVSGPSPIDTIGTPGGSIGQRFGGDSLMAIAPFSPVQSTTSVANPNGDPDLFISNYGFLANGGISTSNQGIAIVVPPGFEPRVVLHIGILDSDNNKLVEGLVQLQHIWGWLDETNAMQSVVTYDAFPVSTFGMSFQVPSVNNIISIATYDRVVSLPGAVSYPVFPTSLNSLDLLYLGCAVRLQQTAASVAPFIAYAGGYGPEGLYGNNRLYYNPYVMLAETTSADQEIILTGEIDVVGYPNPAVAPYLARNATSHTVKETNFFQTSP